MGPLQGFRTVQRRSDCETSAELRKVTARGDPFETSANRP